MMMLLLFVDAEWKKKPDDKAYTRRGKKPIMTETGTHLATQRREEKIQQFIKNNKQ